MLDGNIHIHCFRFRMRSPTSPNHRRTCLVQERTRVLPASSQHAAVHVWAGSGSSGGHLYLQAISPNAFVMHLDGLYILWKQLQTVCRYRVRALEGNSFMPLWCECTEKLSVNVCEWIWHTLLVHRSVAALHAIPPTSSATDMTSHWNISC